MIPAKAPGSVLLNTIPIPAPVIAGAVYFSKLSSTAVTVLSVKPASPSMSPTLSLKNFAISSPKATPIAANEPPRKSLAPRPARPADKPVRNRFTKSPPPNLSESDLPNDVPASSAVPSMLPAASKSEPFASRIASMVASSAFSARMAACLSDSFVKSNEDTRVSTIRSR